MAPQIHEDISRSELQCSCQIVVDILQVRNGSTWLLNSSTIMTGVQVARIPVVSAWHQIQIHRILSSMLSDAFSTETE